MTLTNLAKVFGAVFLLIGVMGFVPGVTTDEGLLLGIFKVSGLHNVIHILSGVAALLAAKSEDHAKTYFWVFGPVYAVIALVGWLQGDTVLGLIDVNTADNWLHTVLAAALLGVALTVKPARPGSTTTNA